MTSTRHIIQRRAFPASFVLKTKTRGDPSNKSDKRADAKPRQELDSGGPANAARLTVAAIKSSGALLFAGVATPVLMHKNLNLKDLINWLVS
jgi:hypothetical protein